jgi:Cu2+-containing amine oxidase
MALREAQNLRRARNEPEALFRLVNERIQHAEAARRLGQHVQPTLGGRVRQWIDQARLDVMADTVRREVAEVRLPTQSRPLTQGRGLGRLITWARGGPQMGAPHELALYHRDQREHYRLAMVQARRFVREQKQAEARASLATEQTHHLRMSRALKGRFASGLADGVSNDGATDPALTAILN